MNYINDHNRRKAEVVTLLSRVADYYERKGEPEKSFALRDMKVATENGHFSIVVVGQFSAGKSTFLNALMGDRYLPSFTTETTATINVLRSVKESPKGQPMILVNYKDGHQDSADQVDLKTIERFVSTKGDNVAQNVSSVEVFFDSPFLNDGVCLVDSPGLNGVLAGHKEITDQQIKRSHAAIFMFNAAQPGSASDFQILGQLRKQCESIIIVLNRIDEVRSSEQSLDDVIAKVKDSYHKQFPSDSIPEIWPIAAYPALVCRSSQALDYHGKSEHSQAEKDEYLKNSKLEAFEERLLRYLTMGEKTKRELLSPIDRVVRFLETSKDDLGSEIQTLESNTDASEIEQQKIDVQTQIDQLDERIKSGNVVISTKIRDILRSAQDEIKSETREIRNRWVAKVNDLEDLSDLEQNAENFINRMNAEYADVYTAAVDKANAEYADVLRAQFAEHVEQVEKSLNGRGTSSDIAMSVTVKLDTSYFGADFDLANYMERRAELVSKMESLEQQADQKEIELVKAEQNEKEYARLEERLERAEVRMSNSLRDLGDRPDVRSYTSYRTEEQSRGTITGLHIRDAILGKKKVQVPYTVQDDSAGIAWQEKRDQMEAEGKRKIEELERKLEAVPTSNVREIELQRKQIERQKSRIEQELESLLEEQRNSVEQQRKKRVRQAKNYVEDRIAESENQGRKQVLDYLADQESKMSITANEIIKVSLSDVLNKKRDELQILEDKLRSGQEKINAEIELKKTFLNEAFDILNEAVDLQEQIDSIKTDFIQVED